MQVTLVSIDPEKNGLYCIFVPWSKEKFSRRLWVHFTSGFNASIDNLIFCRAHFSIKTPFKKRRKGKCAARLLRVHLFYQHMTKWIPHLIWTDACHCSGQVGAFYDRKPCTARLSGFSVFRGCVTGHLQTGQNWGTKHINGEIWTPDDTFRFFQFWMLPPSDRVFDFQFVRSICRRRTMRILRTWTSADPTFWWAFPLWWSGIRKRDSSSWQSGWPLRTWSAFCIWICTAVWQWGMYRGSVTTTASGFWRLAHTTRCTVSV